jgi:putative tricarboxylic transport membrane protein
MPSYAVDYWINTFSKMVQRPEWDKIVSKYSWTKAFMNGKDFENYLDKVNENYKEILREIGLYKE